MIAEFTSPIGATEPVDFLNQREAVATWVVRRKEPLLLGVGLGNVAPLPEFAGITASVLAVPIICEGRVIGVIGAWHGKQNQFHQQELWLAQAYAATIAGSLWRARVAEAIQEIAWVWSRTPEWHWSRCWKYSRGLSLTTAHLSF